MKFHRSDDITLASDCAKFHDDQTESISTILPIKWKSTYDLFDLDLWPCYSIELMISPCPITVQSLIKIKLKWSTQYCLQGESLHMLPLTLNFDLDIWPRYSVALMTSSWPLIVQSLIKITLKALTQSCPQGKSPQMLPLILTFDLGIQWNSWSQSDQLLYRVW